MERRCLNLMIMVTEPVQRLLFFREENFRDVLGFHWGYMGRMEKKVETTIILGFNIELRV